MITRKRNLDRSTREENVKEKGGNRESRLARKARGGEKKLQNEPGCKEKGMVSRDGTGKNVCRTKDHPEPKGG